MSTVDLSGRGLGRLVPGSVGVAYGERRPQWAWSRSAVKQSRSRTVLWPRIRGPSFYTTIRLTGVIFYDDADLWERYFCSLE